MTSRVLVASLTVLAATTSAPARAAGGTTPYRIIGQPVVLRGAVATPSGRAYGNVLIFRVNRRLPEGSNGAIKAVAQVGEVAPFTPPGDSASGWGLVHASRRGVACYSEDLGHAADLPGEKAGEERFFVTARGQRAPFEGHARVVSTRKPSDLSVPITSSAASKLGC
jgi:hypothetical protein